MPGRPISVDGGNKLHVLVVDDELCNLKTFARAFRSTLTITLAHGVDQALDAIARQSFDVALVDFCMPGMNGLELLDRVAATCPDTRRILLTGYAGHSQVERALADGLCEQVIAKPWTKSGLLACVIAGPPTTVGVP